MDHECTEECEQTEDAFGIGSVATQIKIAVYRCISECGLSGEHKMVVMGLVAQALVHSYAMTEHYNTGGEYAFEFILNHTLSTIKDNIMADFKQHREKMH